MPNDFARAARIGAAGVNIHFFMKWYKFTIVLAVGLGAELLFASVSSLLIIANGEWIGSLVLPYFAPKSPLLYGVLAAFIYLFSALSLGFYVEGKRDLPRGVLLTLLEGASELVFLAFFFELTYEITSFFIATGALLLSFINLYVFSEKNDLAGFLRLPVFQIKLYFWMIVYCLLMINFT